MENYKISVLVGEGSFGKVYKATDRKTKDTVALKILSKVSDDVKVSIYVPDFLFPFILAENTKSKRP